MSSCCRPLHDSVENRVPVVADCGFAVLHRFPTPPPSPPWVPPLPFLGFFLHISFVPLVFPGLRSAMSSACRPLHDSVENRVPVVADGGFAVLHRFPLLLPFSPRAPLLPSWGFLAYLLCSVRLSGFEECHE